MYISFNGIEQYIEREALVPFLDEIAAWCRAANDQWWRDPATGNPIQRNKGELIALMHSELSECLEGLRKNLPDDHLPEYPMELVELVDCLIRIFDYLGEFAGDYKISEIFLKKMIYNANRADHKPENRIQGGKQF